MDYIGCIRHNPSYPECFVANKRLAAPRYDGSSSDLLPLFLCAEFRLPRRALLAGHVIAVFRAEPNPQVNSALHGFGLRKTALAHERGKHLVADRRFAVLL